MPLTAAEIERVFSLITGPRQPTRRWPEWSDHGLAGVLAAGDRLLGSLGRVSRASLPGDVPVPAGRRAAATMCIGVGQGIATLWQAGP